MTTSYVTVEEATAILDERLNIEAWTDSIYADKVRATKQATQIINKFNYISSKYEASQVNEFPRLDNLIPDEIKLACCLIALSLLDGVNPDLEQENISVTNRSMSTSKTTYDRGFALEHQAHGVPSAEAWSLMKQFMKDQKSVRVTRVS